MKLSSIILALPLLLVPAVANAGEIMSVKTSSANFRENPHEAAKIKFSADKFFPVEAIEKKKGWVKIKDFEGDTAWVAEKVLGKQATVVVTGDKANIREEASTSSDVSFKVERGEVFKIESRKGDWIKVVDARGDGGWIRSDMTWGDPESKKEPEGKGIETEKPKPSSESATKAKEADKEKEKPVIVEDTIEVKLGKTEHLRALCDSYVHFVWDGAIAPPSDLEVLCRTLLKDKKTEKKVEKISEKKADKKVEKTDKPKAAEKKAQKPKPAAKPKK